LIEPGNKCYSVMWIDSNMEVDTAASLWVEADITALKEMTWKWFYVLSRYKMGTTIQGTKSFHHFQPILRGANL